MKTIIKSIFCWLFLAPFFFLHRWFRNEVFWREFKKSRRTLNWITWLPYRIGRLFVDFSGAIARLYIDFGLKRYDRYSKLHYETGGTGYSIYKGMTREEFRSLFLKLRGRIEAFLEDHGAWLPYLDGDSFLDAGCGRGEQLKSLRDAFPSSVIQAFDVNPDVSRLLGEITDNKTLVEQGDLLDRTYLEKYQKEGIDHVILSHVLAVICGPGLRETIELRRNILSDLIRIAQKSVLIIDSNFLINTGGPVYPALFIEQKTRCALLASILEIIESDRSYRSSIIRGTHDFALLLTFKDS